MDITTVESILTCPETCVFQNPQLWIPILLVVLVLWDGIWTGIGLWKAARNKQLTWFVCMIIFNTIGILPILYIKFFQRKHLPLRQMKKVVVNDKMQSNYTYYLTEEIGKNFDPDFEPELTPKEMLELGVFGGKYMTDCKDEFPKDWFVNAKLSPKK